MPAGHVRMRLDARVLRHEPAWPPWAELAGDYRTAPSPGHESQEFADGAERHAPTGASAALRRRVRVEVPQARIREWRQFLAAAPGRTLRFRDPEDGVLRRAVVEPVQGGIAARQISRRAGPPRWQSELVLVGFADDTVEEE